MPKILRQYTVPCGKSFVSPELGEDHEANCLVCKGAQLPEYSQAAIEDNRIAAESIQKALRRKKPTWIFVESWSEFLTAAEKLWPGPLEWHEVRESGCWPVTYLKGAMAGDTIPAWRLKVYALDRWLSLFTREQLGSTREVLWFSQDRFQVYLTDETGVNPPDTFPVVATVAWRHPERSKIEYKGFTATFRSLVYLLKFHKESYDSEYARSSQGTDQHSSANNGCC